VTSTVSRSAGCATGCSRTSPDRHIGHVIALRKRYWPLALTPEQWEDVCTGGNEDKFHNWWPTLLGHNRWVRLAPDSLCIPPLPARTNLRVHAGGALSQRRAAVQTTSAARRAEEARTSRSPLLPGSASGRGCPHAGGAGAQSHHGTVSIIARDLGVVIVLNLFERDGDRTYDTHP
jgi:hypothetical protein